MVEIYANIANKNDTNADVIECDTMIKVQNIEYGTQLHTCETKVLRVVQYVIENTYKKKEKSILQLRCHQDTVTYVDYM